MRLDDRLTEPQGTFYFSGMTMLVRLTLEQARRDHDAGLRTQTLVTGYPGSPLAGFDLQLARVPGLLSEHAVRHLPAGNEEQAVGALMGTQMLDDYPHENCDGVTGSGTARDPGWTGPVTRSGTATSPAPAPRSGGRAVR